MSAAWRGAFFFTDRVLAYVGAVGSTRLHAHHAVQVAIALGDSTLAFEDRAGKVETGRAFIIPADAHHAIGRPCRRTLLLHVDPESDSGEALEALVQASSAQGWRAAAEALPAIVLDDPRDLRRTTQRLLSPFTMETQSRGLHAAVREALRLLPSLAESGDVRVREVARRVGLSDSRLMHLFREQVGVPLRSYVRWLRLRLAVDQVRRGANLTEAAHAAGFTDSAHLSNVFHATFGLAPSEAVHEVDWVE
jgi:AraC-like DNA-binding protein/mannose-6-phosphate isomerase-like protein (cupin superfamily)